MNILQNKSSRHFFIFAVRICFTFLIYIMAIFCCGLALAPAIAIVLKIWQLGQGLDVVLRYLLLGFGVAAGYMLFGFLLILLAGLVRMVSCLRLQEGNYPVFFSWGVIKWAFLSSLQLLVNFTFINFILLTPLVNLFHRMLGAKLGRSVQINSKYVFDSSLLEIGENTLIGGWALIVGHVVEHGVLKLKKVKIGRNVTIGSRATILPGCEIGDNAIIASGAVLLRNTKVQPRAVYVGVPAQAVKP